MTSPTIDLVTYRAGSRATIDTTGLSAFGIYDFRVDISDISLKEQADEFLRYVVGYQMQFGKIILPEQTLTYGYWIVKFRNATSKIPETWEYDAEAIDYVKGGDLSLRYWRDQHKLCAQNNAAFEPPRADKLTAISKGVLEGLPVHGGRYRFADNMSGWLITSKEYDGSIKSLRYEHTYHITAARPELAQYLALPTGFMFDHDGHQRVWFDDDVAGAVAGLVGIEGGVVSGVFNLESPGVDAPGRRPRHDEPYHEA